MLSRNRSNHICIKRKNIYYDITIKLVVNKKEIIIEADSDSTIYNMYSIVMEILRFENMFEGIFYSTQSFEVDGIECIDSIKEIQRAYYGSTKQYTYFGIDFSDKEYKTYYIKWLKREKKNKLIHPVFLYSTYLEGMPVDLRLAILLEIFEPLAEEMHERGEIELVKSPYVIFTNNCKQCGAVVSRKQPNKKLTFEDKLKPLIKKYGKKIFAGDTKSKLISKAVKIRNKVDHVKADTKNVMSGKQCGAYIYKFSLMYRYMMLLEIGIASSELETTMEKWLEKFNSEYKSLMI